MAFGDEEGSVRLLDSAKDCHQGFSQAHVTFRPHGNAIMDVAFSPDDLRLVTGSGDQTARMVDMRTQQTTYIMTGHSSSVKQAKFQPGQDRIVATCSRDGSLRLWDTRCPENSSSQIQIKTSFGPEAQGNGQDHVSLTRAALVRSVIGAHTRRQPPAPTPGAENSRINTRYKINVPQSLT